MLIDGNSKDRKILIQILEAIESFEFAILSEASNGEDGLFLIGDTGGSPTIIILDQDMPKMGALNILMQIKRKNPDIKVIMSISEQDEIKAKNYIKTLFNCGAVEYIEKPFDQKTVTKKLLKLAEQLTLT